MRVCLLVPILSKIIFLVVIGSGVKDHRGSHQLSNKRGQVGRIDRRLYPGINWFKLRSCLLPFSTCRFGEHLRDLFTAKRVSSNNHQEASMADLEAFFSRLVNSGTAPSSSHDFRLNSYYSITSDSWEM